MAGAINRHVAIVTGKHDWESGAVGRETLLVKPGTAPATVSATPVARVRIPKMFSWFEQGLNGVGRGVPGVGNSS